VTTTPTAPAEIEVDTLADDRRSTMRDGFRVLGVAIRQLSLTQQVIVHGNATAPDVPAAGPSTAGPVLAPDGFGLAEGLRARGIVLGQNPG